MTGVTTLTREAALAELERKRRHLLARIPPGLPAKGRKYPGYVVDEQIQAAGLHLRAIYDNGLAVGPGFSALEPAVAHPKYSFWLEGIRRHLEQCEATLGLAQNSEDTHR